MIEPAPARVTSYLATIRPELSSFSLLNDVGRALTENDHPEIPARTSQNHEKQCEVADPVGPSTMHPQLQSALRPGLGEIQICDANIAIWKGKREEADHQDRHVDCREHKVKHDLPSY